MARPILSVTGQTTVTRANIVCSKMTAFTSPFVLATILQGCVSSSTVLPDKIQPHHYWGMNPELADENTMIIGLKIKISYITIHSTLVAKL